ncbi:MAG: hypothetical protein J6U37_04380 [Lachnospiraceae bacterium]|nr:hypothetical protein [Lachnospiraceae bacterium]
MKITFDNSTKELYRKAVNSYKTVGSVNAPGVGAEIEVGSVSNNNFEYDNKKSIQDIEKSFADYDLKNTQDYMTVMSHQMSPEDFGKMMRDGERPAAVPPEDNVTILDRIKLEVAKSGEEVQGFTDTLDKETLENLKTVGGTLDSKLNKELKDAYEKVTSVDSMTEGMKRYFVTNNLDITPENLYLAKHTAVENTGDRESGFFMVNEYGYLAKTPDSFSDEELSKEVDSLIKTIGMEETAENVESAKWLVNNTIRVTEENIEKVNVLDSISFPIKDKDIFKAFAIAISEGKNPKNADLTRTESKYSHAVKDMDFVKENLALSETRLKMTVEANLKLIESGIAIDTTDLEKYVEELKAFEKTEAYNQIEQLNLVEEAVTTVKTAPIAFIATVAPRIETISLKEVAESAEAVKAKFDKAEIAYETMATEVRRDLGDSIKKAFQNVDDILTELSEDITPENRRAVKILGYNSMPINKESVKEIKEADLKVREVIDKITPSKVLELIRKGEKPMAMSLNDLNKEIDAGRDEKLEEIEKYSKFLYKLEKNNDITAEERKAYIEVYRLFNTLERTGYAAVGTLINQGRDITLGNLKTAAKTLKSTGMDVKVDDSTGYFVSDMTDELSPERLKEVVISDDKDLNTLYEDLTRIPVSETVEQAWEAEEYKNFRQTLDAPEEVVLELLNSNIPVTSENIRGAMGLMFNKAAAFNTVRRLNKHKFDEDMNAVEEALDEKEGLSEAYDELIEDSKEAVYSEIIETDTYIDVKALKNVYLQLSVAGKKAKEENYHVPVEIGGELTEINLKVVHNEDKDPNVTITTSSFDLGTISARFTLENEKISGYIASNNKETVSKLENVADNISEDIKVIYVKNPENYMNSARLATKENVETVSFDSLYKVSKVFLQAVKGIK